MRWEALCLPPLMSDGRRRKMKRSVTILGILLAFMLSLAIGLNAANAAPTCGDLVADHEYDYCAMDEFGNIEGVLLFFSGGSSPADFPLEIYTGHSDVFYACTNQAKGKIIDKAKLETSKNCQCIVDHADFVNPEGIIFHFDLAGFQFKVKGGGKKLGAMQGVDTLNESVVIGKCPS